MLKKKKREFQCHEQMIEFDILLLKRVTASFYTNNAFEVSV